jgi:membrane-bound metal-dependent hydrolase YbcI (DUF457 family)
VLFVGHISLAFLIVYFLSTRFQNLKRSISVTLVMFLSILPDIDIIFRLAGLDLGHRTITHSAIIWLALGVGVIIILFLTSRTRKGRMAAVYLLAFLSHIVIGDIIVGPINVLYPIGDLVVNSPINGIEYYLVEVGVLTVMASVVITEYYSFKKRMDEDTFLFRYHCKIDSLLYPILILALITSFFYVLVKFELDLFEISVLAPLHFFAICLIVFMWRVSKNARAKTQKELVSTR